MLKRLMLFAAIMFASPGVWAEGPVVSILMTGKVSGVYVRVGDKVVPAQSPHTDKLTGKRLVEVDLGKAMPEVLRRVVAQLDTNLPIEVGDLVVVEIGDLNNPIHVKRIQSKRLKPDVEVHDDSEYRQPEPTREYDGSVLSAWGARHPT